MIEKLKKENHNKLKAGSVDENLITADLPIPFNVKKVWYEMNWWLNATFSNSPYIFK